MAKQVFTIKDFSGGLNTDKSTRGLEDNELARCTNLDPTSKGRVTRNYIFIQNNANYTDQPGSSTAVAGVTAGYGLTTFANDNKVSDKAAYTGEFICKSDGDASGAAEIDILEPANTWTEGNSGGTTAFEDNSTTPVFYAAEGDIFCGGDHSTAPKALIYHEHNKFVDADDTGYATPAWLTSTQAKPQPDYTNDMDMAEATGSATITGLGANKLDWIIKYGADNSGLWTNKIDQAKDAGGYYEFGGSWLYKNNAESAIEELNTGSDYDTPMDNNATHTEANVRIQAWAKAVSTSAHDAVYGARLYTRENTEGEWYMLAEMNYDKGIRAAGEADWNPWINATDTDTVPDFDHTDDGFEATTGIIPAPPNLFTFKINNGYSEGDIVTDNLVYWKTGIVANSRAYVGNVKLGTKVFGDRILKSPIFQYDVFTENNYLDVAINDGDQITALAGHGDRILEFKNNAVYIINVSKELEFLEDEQQGAGVEWQAAVVTTPMGVVWVNQTGCFFYDGSEISQLQAGKIDSTEWNTNVTTSAIIGYDTINQQVIILSTASSSGSGYGYIFDATSGAWYRTSDVLDQTQNCTNMANARGDNLIVGGGPAIADILTLTARAGTGTATLETKVFDFGNPESKKNLLEVAVSYKYGTATTGLLVKVSADHGSFTTVGTGNGLTDTSGDIAVTEFDTSSQAAFQGKKTFQVQITGTAHQSFELYSITLTYRDLGTH